jgi:hypothetical protein
MKKILLASLLTLSAQASLNANEIMLSKSIKPTLRHKIERDLRVIENFKFADKAKPATLRTMNLVSLNSTSATDWLNQRVNYIVSENALSAFNLLVNRVLYVERTDVDFPNSDITPYSSEQVAQINEAVADNGASFTVMSNIGAALYMGGKTERQVYGMKVSRGFLHKSERVLVTSPRAGIIQIGEGLFSPELTINQQNEEALANSIFRLGTFFHEARHSDGNGKSLSFVHALCPPNHDYEGQPACDENLNGPYTIGALMMTEMAKTCDINCSEKDKQALAMIILDSANRILKTTHKGEPSTHWDEKPEGLD